MPTQNVRWARTARDLHYSHSSFGASRGGSPGTGGPQSVPRTAFSTPRAERRPRYTHHFGEWR